jgi:homoserine dehydrogenase
MTYSPSAVGGVSWTSPRRRTKVAIAGYGIVGQALAERLAGDAAYEIVAILVRDPARPRRVAPPCPLTTDRRALLARRPDVLIDVLSCAETGALLSELALARGIDLVSASKRVIAGAYPSLVACAAGGEASFLYSAAVGGETPILETVAAAAAEQEVTAVAGIFNGTVNFILGRLARGLCYETALKEAQALGFAEENPHEDVSGADAAAKLRIVAATAFGGVPGDYDFPADALDLDKAARIAASGERWVQLARVERRDGRVTGSVALVPRSAAGVLPLAEDEWNCALVTTTDGFSRSCLGRGAGGAATAGAILSDLSLLARERAPA